MNAEVISIGDELTSGQRLDTNSQWLSERLGELGVRVLYHTTVADDLAANVRVFREAIERADLVVATGGLGPTADDLTRDALAEATGCPLELNAEALQRLRDIFAFFKRDMPERNRVQAMFPRGSTIIPNPHGTAPGIQLAAPRASGGQAQVFALPGVPAEMTEMWQNTVADEIRRVTGATHVLRHRRIKCFGAGESHVEQMLPDLIRRGRDPSVGITVSGATITLRITARGASADECLARMQPTVETIYECLGDLVFGEEDDELEHAVLRLLAERRATLATAEWGTGGLVAHWLNELSDAGTYYLGGVVIGGADAAERLLGVPAELYRQHGGASGEVVEALARNCRQQSGAEYGLAISELPVMDPSAAESPRVFVALASADEAVVRSVPYVGHPSIHKTRTAKVGLNLVRLALTKGRLAT